MTERTVLLITVLIGAIGWLFTHVVERVTDSPTVEYRLTTSQTADGGLLKIRLVNVTRSTSFQMVRFLILAPTDGRIREVEVRPVEPSFEGDIEPHVFGRSADLTIERFMPGARFYVLVAYSGNERPRLRASSADAPIRFQRRSLETVFARYELVILAALAALYLIIALTMFGRWWFVSARENDSQAAHARGQQ